jgi:DNA repair photolyase
VERRNPSNALTGRACVDTAPPPEARPAVWEEAARSILTRNQSPDVPYEWSVNPYRGCAHACSYCYARRTHEYFELGAGTDFETRIAVKTNAPALLRAALARRGWHRQQIALSGVTDCYQPLEAEYRLTRQCLEVCRDFANPVGIVTKSPLVTRDLDVLTALHERATAEVLFSVTFADDRRARQIEPGAPPPTARLRALRKLRAAGIPAGLLICPVIPGLNDRDIPRLVAQAADAGATTIDLAPIRLPGSVADVFLDRLRHELPLEARRVEGRIRAIRAGRLNDARLGRRLTGSGDYWRGILRLFEAACTRHGLPRRDTSPVAPTPPPPQQGTLFNLGP